MNEDMLYQFKYSAKDPEAALVRVMTLCCYYLIDQLSYVLSDSVKEKFLKSPMISEIGMDSEILSHPVGQDLIIEYFNFLYYIFCQSAQSLTTTPSAATEWVQGMRLMMLRDLRGIYGGLSFKLKDEFYRNFNVKYDETTSIFPSAISFFNKSPTQNRINILSTEIENILHYHLNSNETFSTIMDLHTVCIARINSLVNWKDWASMPLANLGLTNTKPIVISDEKYLARTLKLLTLPN